MPTCGKFGMHTLISFSMVSCSWLQVYSEFAWANPLHPEVFPDIRKMEAEVVRMACHMFNGDLNTCGTVHHMLCHSMTRADINR